MNLGMLSLHFIALLLYMALISCKPSSNHLKYTNVKDAYPFVPRQNSHIYSSIRHNPWNIDNTIHAKLSRLRRFRSRRRVSDSIRSKYRFIAPRIEADEPNLYEIPRTTSSTTSPPETTSIRSTSTWPTVPFQRPTYRISDSIRSKYRFIAPRIEADEPKSYDLPRTTRSTTTPTPETTTTTYTWPTVPYRPPTVRISEPIRSKSWVDDPDMYVIPRATRSTTTPTPETTTTVTTTSTWPTVPYRRPAHSSSLFKSRPEPEPQFQPEPTVPFFQFRKKPETTTTTTKTTTTRKPRTTTTTTRKPRPTTTTTPLPHLEVITVALPEPEIGEESVQGRSYGDDAESGSYYQRSLMKDEQLLAAICPNIYTLPVKTQEAYAEVCDKLKDKYQPKPIFVSDNGQDVIQLNSELEGESANGEFENYGIEDENLNVGVDVDGVDAGDILDDDLYEDESGCRMLGVSKTNTVLCLLVIIIWIFW